MLWFFGLSVVGGLAALFLLARRDERAVRRDWELLLTPKGQKLYSSIEGNVQSEMALAEVAYDDAFTVRELGSVEEAIRLLDVGYQVIERFAPNMLRLLAAMATFSRMVSAITPLPPLRPKDFRLPQLVSLAYLNQVLHQFAVSASERFRLRVYVLGRSFGLASRFLLRSTRRIAEQPTRSDDEWEQIQAIRKDFQTLTEESMVSLRALLTSLEQEHREDLIRRLDE